MPRFDSALAQLARVFQAPRNVARALPLTGITRSLMTTLSGLLLLAIGQIATGQAPSAEPDFKAISAAVLAAGVGLWVLALARTQQFNDARRSGPAQCQTRSRRYGLQRRLLGGANFAGVAMPLAEPR